jgi:tRNA (guanosine-2'-O-)-methyltransferase
MRALDPEWQGQVDRTATSRRLADRCRRAGGRSGGPASSPARRVEDGALLGHEWHGIPDDQVEAADVCVEIPMVGQGASLNVAVAGSLVLYRLAGLA